jgi:hypothetical protein
MLTFAFPEELLRFQYHNPAFEPLFQFPPTWASAHHESLLFNALGDCVPQTP